MTIVFFNLKKRREMRHVKLDN